MPQGTHSPVDSAFDSFQRQQQQELLQDHDRSLAAISGTLDTLGEQAGLITQELGEQTGILADLNHALDRTSDRLETAKKRMGAFIRQSEGSSSCQCVCTMTDYFMLTARGSGWCIIILIIILVILMIMIVLM